MMPTTKGQGQSDVVTERKIRGISSALALNMTVFKSLKRKNARARYQHFDLNAGSGINEDAGCIGSPLAFLEATKIAGVNHFNAHFVDHNKGRIKELLKRPGMEAEECNIHYGDNRTFALSIPGIIIHHGERPERALGSVLVDPNGTAVNIDILHWLSAQCPKLDFIINWNAAAFKRCQGDKGRLEDITSPFVKRHWLIRDALGPWQWSLLIGRNFKMNDHKSEGFHHLDSPMGQKIFRKLNHTKKELEGEIPELF